MSKNNAEIDVKFVKSKDGKKATIYISRPEKLMVSDIYYGFKGLLNQLGIQVSLNTQIEDDYE